MTNDIEAEPHKADVTEKVKENHKIVHVYVVSLPQMKTKSTLRCGFVVKFRNKMKYGFHITCRHPNHFTGLL